MSSWVLLFELRGTCTIFSSWISPQLPHFETQACTRALSSLDLHSCSVSHVCTHHSECCVSQHVSQGRVIWFIVFVCLHPLEYKHQEGNGFVLCSLESSVLGTKLTYSKYKNENTVDSWATHGVGWGCQLLDSSKFVYDFTIGPLDLCSQGWLGRPGVPRQTGPCGTWGQYCGLHSARLASLPHPSPSQDQGKMSFGICWN